MSEHKPLPNGAFNGGVDIDPLTGQYTPGTESRRTYGSQDKKKPEVPEEPVQDHWYPY